jgi:hypothetical protein
MIKRKKKVFNYCVTMSFGIKAVVHCTRVPSSGREAATDQSKGKAISIQA